MFNGDTKLQLTPSHLVVCAASLEGQCSATIAGLSLACAQSKLVRMQAERDAGGSIILHWRVGEIENVIVPVVDMETQTQIANLVQQSFALKAESERLLATAKRAVEIAIETDEQTAMDYLNNQTGEP